MRNCRCIVVIDLVRCVGRGRIFGLNAQGGGKVRDGGGRRVDVAGVRLDVISVGNEGGFLWIG